MGDAGPPKPRDQAREQLEQQRKEQQLQRTLGAREGRSQEPTERGRREKQSQDTSGVKRSQDKSTGQQQFGKVGLDRHEQRERDEQSKENQRLKQTLEARNGKKKEERISQTLSSDAKEHKQTGRNTFSETQRHTFEAMEKQFQNARFMDKAQRYNNQQGYSVDTIRRLEALFGVAHSKEGESGKFSKELVQVVAMYQQAKELKVDGMLGEKQTLKSLRHDFGWMLVDSLKGPGKEGREIIPRDATQSDRYNYYQRLVTDCYGVWRSEKGEINMIGIRGMQDGKQVQNVVGRSNDTMAIAWIDKDGNKRVREFTGSVDPGIVRKPMNEKGVAHIKDGSYVYKLGWHTHHGKADPKELRNYINGLPDKDKAVRFRGSKNYEALKQVSIVTVYRDRDRQGQPGHGYIEAKEMVEDRDKKFGIDMHFSGPKNPWSQGCQVIPGARDYVEFIRTVKEGTNSDAIPYTVIDASKREVMPKHRYHDYVLSMVEQRPEGRSTPSGNGQATTRQRLDQVEQLSPPSRAISNQVDSAGMPVDAGVVPTDAGATPAGGLEGRPPLVGRFRDVRTIESAISVLEKYGKIGADPSARIRERGTLGDIETEIDRLVNLHADFLAWEANYPNLTSTRLRKLDAQLLERFEMQKRYARERELTKGLKGDSSVLVLFDGSKLALYDKNNPGLGDIEFGEALSGQGKMSSLHNTSRDAQKQIGQGSIPEGTYWLDLRQIDNNWFYQRGAWGKQRLTIHPFKTTHTFGRGGFFIHGGDEPGGAGCIDLHRQGDQWREVEFFKGLTDLVPDKAYRVRLVVDYSSGQTRWAQAKLAPEKR